MKAVNLSPAVVVTTDPSGSPTKSSWLIHPLCVCHSFPGEMDTELFKEWFQAFSQSAGITLHVENIYGDNSHHIIESCFKGLARALRLAMEKDSRAGDSLPSTKGIL